jgi:hypothetical protein
MELASMACFAKPRNHATVFLQPQTLGISLTKGLGSADSGRPPRPLVQFQLYGSPTAA